MPSSQSLMTSAINLLSLILERFICRLNRHGKRLRICPELDCNVKIGVRASKSRGQQIREDT